MRLDLTINSVIEKSNLFDYREHFNKEVANIDPETLSTDEDFEKAEEYIKDFKAEEKILANMEKEIFQDNVKDIIADLKKIALKLKTTRILLEKAVDANKKSKKKALVDEYYAKLFKSINDVFPKDDWSRMINNSKAITDESLKHLIAESIKGKKTKDSIKVALQAIVLELENTLVSEVLTIKNTREEAKQKVAEIIVEDDDPIKKIRIGATFDLSTCTQEEVLIKLQGIGAQDIKVINITDY